MEIAPCGSTRRPSSVHSSILILALLASACGPLVEAPEATGGDAQTQSLESSGDLTLNGLSLNGLSLNGLSLNGLSLNGLSLNGLSLSGLSTSQFDSWFQGDPALNERVMNYVVRCAVPPKQSRTYTSAQTGQSWTWAGSLGLAPGWSNGQRPTLAEQRLVSACLAAHANKFGVNISMSIQGRDALGTLVPTTAQELQDYSQREGCFFGNLFNSEGLYAGNDSKPLNSKQSTTRACALSSKKSGPPECEPIVRVDPDCSDICTLDSTGTSYVSCTYKGITYPALTTRMLRSDIYTCGDGTCQLSEKCGTGSDYDNCLADCGRCP